MKATEYRLHLLYIAAVAFKSALPSNVYNHFLLLHVASANLSLLAVIVSVLCCAECRIVYNGSNKGMNRSSICIHGASISADKQRAIIR